MKNILKRRFLNLLVLLLISGHAFGQFSEELVVVNYQINELTSIKVLSGVEYISQLTGGVAINSDDNYYIFASEGSESKLRTIDILTGETLYKVDIPQIQMIQYVGTDELVGITKKNLSNEVSLSRYNYKTGAITSYPIIDDLEGVSISTHNSAVDVSEEIFYFVGSIPGTNNWSIIAIDYTDGSLIKIMDGGEFLGALAFDKDRKKLLGLITITADGKSLVEVNPVAETVVEIKKIPEINNIFGGHRYWAYDDDQDRFFVIGLDGTNESYWYVLDSNTGAILFQHLYEDDAWIMEEHSPLELRYNSTTGQLLGLRKGEPLVVSSQELKKHSADFKLFPNPNFNQQVNIEVSNGEKIRTVQLVDIYGKVTYQKNKIDATHVQFKIDEFASGVYYVVLKTDQGLYSQKLIKY